MLNTSTPHASNASTASAEVSIEGENKKSLAGGTENQISVLVVV